MCLFLCPQVWDDIQLLISTGDLPLLFTKQEKAEIVDKVSEALSSQSRMQSIIGKAAPVVDLGQSPLDPYPGGCASVWKLSRMCVCVCTCRGWR